MLSDTAVLAGMPADVGVRLATAALADDRLLQEWLERRLRDRRAGPVPERPPR